MADARAPIIEPEKASLLVVDDDETNRFTLVSRLKRMGFTQVETAADGKRAIDLLTLHAFDLVFLDIMMPGLDGIEVLQRMKAEPRLADVPVIVVSALDDIDAIVTSIQFGAEDYLPKPFNPILLRARVAACLEKKLIADRVRGEAARHRAALLDALADGVVIVDPVGLVVGANRAAATLLGQAEAALVGCDVARLLPGVLDRGADPEFRPLTAPGPSGDPIPLAAATGLATRPDGIAELVISLRAAPST